MIKSVQSAMSRAVRIALAVVSVLAASQAASAAPPVFAQGANLGTVAAGLVEIPLSATGGDGVNYAWELTAGSLPPGVSLRRDVEPWFSSSTAGLMGVATTPGIYTFTLKVTSGGESATQDVTLKISSLIIADYWTLPDAFVNAPYQPHTFTAMRDGLPATVTWTATFGLPPGMSLTDGVLSGTPTMSGFYNIGLSASDGIDTIFRNVSLSVFDIEIATPSLLPNATQNAPYHAVITATGGSGTYTFTSCDGCAAGASAGLPSGLTLNPSTGEISGTVTGAGAGPSWFNITATDANGVSAVKLMSIYVVSDPPSLPFLPNPFFGTPCTLYTPCVITTFASFGGRAPFTWRAVGLPPGLDIHSGDAATPSWITSGDEAAIVGTAALAGTFDVTITATDADGISTSNTFPLYVSPLDPTQFLADGTVGTPYFRQLRVVGGPSRPLAPGTGVSQVDLYSAAQTSGHLPAGLTFDPATFTVQGTPLENGNFSSTFRFTDLDGDRYDLFAGLFIAGTGNSTVQINSFYDLGTAFVGSVTSRTLFACCLPSYKWSVEPGSNLPAGLTLGPSTGVISGSPTSAGSYQFLVRVEDPTFPANFALRQFVLAVKPASAFSVVGANLPFGNVGAAYGGATGIALATSGASGAVTWAVAAGSFLPPGITLSPAGVLSGTPTSAGQFFFTLNALDAAGHTAAGGFAVAIYPAGAAPPLNLSIGSFLVTLGQLTLPLSATGGTAPYHYSQTPGTSAVPGMRVQDGQPLPIFTTATAAYVGVVAVPGVYHPSIRVTDANGSTFDKVFTLTVSSLVALSQPSLPKATVGKSYSFPLVAYGGSGNYSWTVDGFSALPPGLTLSASGEISGTPTAAGSFFISTRLTDSSTSDTTGIGYSLVVDPFEIATGGVLPQATVGTPYNQPLSAPGCGSPCTWSGFPPAGLTLSTSGVLSGTPTFTTTTFFTVTASGSAGTVQKVFSMVVAAAALQPLTINMSSVISATTVGNFVGQPLFAVGGTAPYTWRLHAGDSLPPGIDLRQPGEAYSSFFGPGFAYLSGRAVQAGLYTFALDVSDAGNVTVSRTFTWRVSALASLYFNLPLTGRPLVFDQPYQQPLLVIGGTGNYTWTATSPLPPGLSLDPSTGILSGTPGNTGSFFISFDVTDDGGNVLSSAISLTIASPTGTTLNTPGFNSTISQGSSASFSITPSGGTGPYTVTALTPLPPGFALLSGSTLSGVSGATNYVVQGVGLTPGKFTFTLRAQDSAGNIGVRSSTITVVPLVVLTTSLSDASVGVPYAQTLTAFDSAGPVTWSVAAGSALPPGLTLSPAGVISGTPTSAGTFSLNLTATDSVGSIAFFFSLRVSALAIADVAALPVGVVGQPYSFTFSGSGGSIVWSAAGPPAGLTLSADGSLSGTPTAAGSFTVLVIATDGIVPISKRFLFYVRAVNPAVLDIPRASAALADAVVGQRVSVTLNASGGQPPYAWSVAAGSTLPPGLQLLSGSSLPSGFTAGSTVLGGAPAAAGVYAFDLIATDASGARVVRTFSLNVTPIALLNTSLSPATVNSPYSLQLTAVGGSAPYTFSATPLSLVQDALPPGFTLSPTGLLAGTTASTGIYSLVVHVADGAGHTFARTLSLLVSNASGLRVTNVNPADTGAGRRAVILLSTNGTSTYTWSLVGGSLPPGVSIVPRSQTATVLAGPPSGAGIYTFTLRATDAANSANSADHEFTWRVGGMQLVAPSLEFAPAGLDALPAGQVGASYSFAFKVAGGAPPYTFAEAAFNPLPAGLSLSPSGVLSGVPQQAGASTLQPMITDAAGNTISGGSIALTIAPAGTAAPLTKRSSPSVGGASVGALFTSYPLDTALITGGTAPFAWSLASGSSLPPGLTLLPGGNGVPTYVGGIPSAAGSYVFDLIATDSSGQSLTTTVTLPVSPIALTPGATPPATVGTPYSVAFVASGGTAPYALQLSLDSSLPAGLAFQDGVLSGTPTLPGNYLVLVSVADADANSLVVPYRITVDDAAGQAPAVRIEPKPLQLQYEVGAPNPAPIRISIGTSTGTFAYNLSLAGIPGATLSSSAGTTPATANVNLNFSGVPVGTYAGVIGVVAPGTANVFDTTPVAVTVVAPPPCTYAVNPADGSVPAAGGSGTFAIATADRCAWSATPSDPWITVTSQSTGTGAGTLTYTIDSNVGVDQRTGSITVNGAVYAITQFGSSCSFAIAPALVNAPAAGGTATIAITASGAACAWTATGLGAAPAAGSGSASVTVTIQPNSNPASQIVTAAIGGQTLTVTQAGAGCTLALSQYAATVPAAGGSGSITVTTPASCAYSTAPGPGWIAVSSGGSGVGPGTLTFSVDANSTTTPRSGTLMVNGQSLFITQEPLACGVTVDTSSLGGPFGVAGGAGTIGIVANGANCSWSAPSVPTWASLTQTSGIGSAVIGVTIASNAGSPTARTGVITLAGQDIALAQNGTACTYALQSPAGTVPATGGRGTVGVIAAPACAWTAASDDPTWLTILPSGGAGSADVEFSASPNSSSSGRSGTLTIAGRTYTISQPAAACSVAIDSDQVSVASTGVSSASFAVTTASACSASAVSYTNWIIASGGTDSGAVTYSVLPNPLATARSGTIQVGNHTFTITEAGGECGYSLHAYGAFFDYLGGNGTIFGSPSALGCTPTNGTTQPSWLSLGPLAGPNNNIFTQDYTVATFDTLTGLFVRRGQIVFGGTLFTIKQTSAPPPAR